MRIVFDKDELLGHADTAAHLKCKCSLDCGTGEVIFYFKWEGDLAGLVALSVNQYVMDMFSEVKAHKKSKPFEEMLDLWGVDLITGKVKADESTL